MEPIDISLNYKMEHQQGDNWCWAATGKSTSVFYDSRSQLTQCSIANDVCGKTTCCANRHECDVPQNLSDTLKATGNYVDHFRDVISWQKIRSAIESGRVVCARIKWDGGGGHFVAIFGVAKIGTTRKLHIDDPISGKSLIGYEKFRDNYRDSGTWTHTYFTNAKNGAN